METRSHDNGRATTAVEPGEVRPGRARTWWASVFRRSPGPPPPGTGYPSRGVRRRLALAARRDADASLPVMSTPVPAPTAIVTAIVAERDLVLGRELWAAAEDVEPVRSGLAALRVRIAAATLAVDDAERRLAAAAGNPAGTALRRLGEDALDDATVEQRRLDESRRHDDELRAALGGVRAVRDRLLERAADLQARLEQRTALAQARAGEIVATYAERCAVYVEELTRRHPDGPTLLHLRWPELPPPPAWTTDRQAALTLLAPDRTGGEDGVDDLRPGRTYPA